MVLGRCLLQKLTSRLIGVGKQFLKNKKRLCKNKEATLRRSLLREELWWLDVYVGFVDVSGLDVNYADGSIGTRVHWYSMRLTACVVT